MGEPDGSISPRLTALQNMMAKGEITAETSDDIERSLWEKFVFLVGLSSTTTLMRTTLGPIREYPESREFLSCVMSEATAVGRAIGVNLPEDFAGTRLDFADGLPVDMTSSMHHDFEAGNKLELPWLAGTIVRLGREAGIATPVCQTVYAALLPKAGGTG
jgi:2-dehydropantoate 2-reductase